MIQRALLLSTLALLCATAARGASIAADSLQAAIAAARPGDTIDLAAQTYAGDFQLSASGAPGAPITLRGAPAWGSRIAGSLRVTGSYWIIQGVEVDVAWDDRDAIRIDAAAHDIAIRSAHLHNGRAYGVRVGNDAARVTIEDSIIEHFDAGDKDAHGVGIMTASDVTIRRCDIFATSGDAIQVNTPDYPGYGRAASGILIEQNKLHHARENALDIKSTHGIVVRNNLAWSFAAVDSSDGMAIQVQYDARDVQIVGNQIWSAAEGIEVSRGVKNGAPYPLAPQRVLIAGNLIHDLVDDPNGDSGSGSGIVVRSSGAVRLYNNTVLGAPGAGIYASYSASGDYPQGLEIRNNVLGGAASDLHFAFDPRLAPGLIVDHNHYRGGRVSGGSLSRWLGLGLEANATSGDPQLDPVSMRPLAGSPLLDSGAELGLPHSGAAPDRGWGELGGSFPTLAATQQLYLAHLRR